MSVGLAFHPSVVFNKAYQRNNKSNGQKNLRCFPTHSLSGHQSHWCGQPLCIRVSHSPPGLRIVGEFLPLVASSQGSIEADVGGVVKKLSSELVEAQPSVAFPNFAEHLDSKRKEWEGATGKTAPPAGEPVTEWVFNGVNKGWHYGFVGSKRDCNLYHIWRMHAMVPNEGPGGGFRVVARLDSPPFHLFCRRRNRGPLALERMKDAAGPLIAPVTLAAGSAPPLSPPSPHLRFESETPVVPDQPAAAPSCAVTNSPSPALPGARRASKRLRPMGSSTASSACSAAAPPESLSDVMSDLLSKVEEPQLGCPMALVLRPDVGVAHFGQRVLQAAALASAPATSASASAHAPKIQDLLCQPSFISSLAKLGGLESMRAAERMLFLLSSHFMQSSKSLQGLPIMTDFDLTWYTSALAAMVADCGGGGSVDA
jgi:hypothetical protein